eukprot:TRINITY_DN4385_c0_g2_i1.p1 TRINITY_DN4385_c0_g2~~TRINITY_DN4385_c0_g2_i1.p1  ORF type:complete len:347 (+),score=33.95 TRINITY_DN4385_c0_g2_i1:49-1089(+)
MSALPEQKPNNDNLLMWIKALGLCVTYISVGPGLIVVNKHILHDLGFSYPVTLSSLGQVFIAAVCWTLVKTEKASISPEAWEQVTSRTGMLGCFLVGLFKALTLSFGNAVYLHLNMGYIQMLKAFSPVLMLFLLVITGVEGRPKFMIMLSVLAIALFTAATTALESHATPMGLMLMALAQSTECFALVVTQFLLKKKKMSIIESQCFLAPPTCACLFAFAAFGGEWTTIYVQQDYKIVSDNVVLFAAAASLGSVVNYLTFAVIQATSGTMLKVLGTVRNIIVVIVGATMYHESIPMKEWLCYGGTLFGFMSYTYQSINKGKEAPPATPKNDLPPSDEDKQPLKPSS